MLLHVVSLVLRKLAGLAFTVLLGGLLAATLVRLSPGWDVDERELDLRRSEQSIQALREAKSTDSSTVSFYARYLTGLLRGDLGNSRSFHRPVTEILAERLPQTARTVALGCGWAWAFGLLAAIAATSSNWRLWELLTATASGMLLSLPAAAIGLIALWTGIGVEWAVCAAVFPKVFSYAQELFRQAYMQPHLLTAMAKGLSKTRILLAHVMRPVLHELLAIAAVSVGVAFGATIPLEVVCDSPGLGQLAWQSATARDLPVLVSLTLLVTLTVKSAGVLADVSRSALGDAA